MFLFDEVQFLSTVELEALIAALHKTVQCALPITLVGAGLPQLPRLAEEAKSYAERLFKALDVDYERAAVFGGRGDTEGYPYFIQGYGNVLWDLNRLPSGFTTSIGFFRNFC